MLYCPNWASVITFVNHRHLISMLSDDSDGDCLQKVDTTQSTSGERFVIKIHDSGSQRPTKSST